MVNIITLPAVHTARWLSTTAVHPVAPPKNSPWNVSTTALKELTRKEKKQLAAMWEGMHALKTTAVTYVKDALAECEHARGKKAKGKVCADIFKHHIKHSWFAFSHCKFHYTLNDKAAELIIEHVKERESVEGLTDALDTCAEWLAVSKKYLYGKGECGRVGGRGYGIFPLADKYNDDVLRTRFAELETQIKEVANFPNLEANVDDIEISEAPTYWDHAVEKMTRIVSEWKEEIGHDSSQGEEELMKELDEMASRRPAEAEVKKAEEVEEEAEEERNQPSFKITHGRDALFADFGSYHICSKKKQKQYNEEEENVDDEEEEGHVKEKVVEEKECDGSCMSRDKRGRGTYGSVFETCKGFAIKKTHERQDGDDEIVHFEAAVKEIAALRKLDHPNIIKCLGANFTRTGSSSRGSAVAWDVSMAMEVALGTLDKLELVGSDGTTGSVSADKKCFKGVSDPTVRRSVYAQLLAALAYCHSPEINVWHQDVKPRNVLVFRDRNGGRPDLPLIKLADFGTCLPFAMKSHNNFLTIQSQYWRAPEIFLGYGPFDAKIDTWSVGVMFFDAVVSGGQEKLFEHSDTEEVQLATIIEVIGYPYDNVWEEGQECIQKGSMLAKPKGPFDRRVGSLDKRIRECLQAGGGGVTPEEAELIKGLVAWPPQRLTAQAALQLDYFTKPVRVAAPNNAPNNDPYPYEYIKALGDYLAEECTILVINSSSNRSRPASTSSTSSTSSGRALSDSEILCSFHKSGNWPPRKEEKSGAVAVAAATQKKWKKMFEKHTEKAAMKFRSILFEWLRDVANKFKYRRQTLFHAYLLFDLFIDRLEEKKYVRTHSKGEEKGEGKEVDKVTEIAEVPDRGQLQIYGMAAMLISSWLYEASYPELRDWTYICDRAYTKPQIIQCIVNMLTVLEFDLIVDNVWERIKAVQDASDGQAFTISDVVAPSKERRHDGILPKLVIKHVIEEKPCSDQHELAVKILHALKEQKEGKEPEKEKVAVEAKEEKMKMLKEEEEELRSKKEAERKKREEEMKKLKERKRKEEEQKRKEAEEEECEEDARPEECETEEEKPVEEEKEGKEESEEAVYQMVGYARLVSAKSSEGERLVVGRLAPTLHQILGRKGGNTKPTEPTKTISSADIIRNLSDADIKWCAKEGMLIDDAVDTNEERWFAHGQIGLKLAIVTTSKKTEMEAVLKKEDREGSIRFIKLKAHDLRWAFARDIGVNGCNTATVAQLLEMSRLLSLGIFTYPLSAKEKEHSEPNTFEHLRASDPSQNTATIEESVRQCECMRVKTLENERHRKIHDRTVQSIAISCPLQGDCSEEKAVKAAPKKAALKAIGDAKVAKAVPKAKAPKAKKCETKTLSDVD